MCLYVKENCKPEIATEDIHCYKKALKSKDGWQGYFQKYFEYSETIFPWNTIVTAKNNLNDPIEHLEIISNFLSTEQYITRGFHACIGKIPFPSLFYHYCIIPAGSEYCYGKYDEIVSTQMIVFRRKFDYLLYILKKKIKQ
jgi:hypothetical protein